MDEEMILTSGAEEQEAADPAMSDAAEVSAADTGNEAAQDEAEGEKETEPAAPSAEPEQRKRTADASFAQMRRQAQEAAQRAQEATRKAEEAEGRQRRLLEAMGKLGFTGADPDEVADRAIAHYTGRTVDEVRAERERKAREDAQAKQAQGEAERLRQQNLTLLAQMARQRMEKDLQAIRRIDPKVKSLEDLGPEFGSLIRQGISAEIAYRAIAEQRKAGEVTAPPKAGKVNAKTKAEKDYYTPEEVDRLTEKELDDPGVMQKVMKSMTRWK